MNASTQISENEGLRLRYFNSAPTSYTVNFSMVSIETDLGGNEEGLGGEGIAAVLLVFFLRGIPHQPLVHGKRGVVNKQEQAAKPPDNHATASYSVLPLMDRGRRPEEGADKNMLRPEEIARKANKQPKLSAGTNFAGIPPYGNSQSANTALDQASMMPAEAAQNQRPLNEAAETRCEREALERPSLVFVRTNKASNAVPRQPTMASTLEKNRFSYAVRDEWLPF